MFLLKFSLKISNKISIGGARTPWTHLLATPLVAINVGPNFAMTEILGPDKIPQRK